MKKQILISSMLLLSVIANAQRTDFPKLTGPSLGQKPPGLDAKARKKAEERHRLDQEALALIIPESRHIALPGIGHDVSHQAPGAVVSAILDMLSRIATPSPLSARPREAPSRPGVNLDERFSVFAPFIGPTWLNSIPSDTRLGEIALRGAHVSVFVAG